MTTGIVGIGKMGRPIAEHLSENGEALVLWNRSSDKALNIARSAVVATPKAVAENSSILLSILANDLALEATYHGPNGLLEADLTGKTIVELCSTSPAMVQSLEKAVTERGGLFLECPVGGSVVPARSGQLMGLAGGTQAAFDSAKPLLTKITRRLEYLGPVGSGAAMKSAINLPLMVYWSALGEALGLAMSKGVDPSLALDILGDSSGAIGSAKKRILPIHDMLVKGDPGVVSFSLTNAIKDMKLMIALARASGSPHDVIHSVLTKAETAAANGWDGYDSSLVGVYGQTNKKTSP
ncbi:MAG: NAD(P)-dependent oxidoreductase [Paracoccaceae bacterium]